MTDNFQFLGEPSLQFGHGQTAEDPHDGLALFGPAEQRAAMPDHIVIGTGEGVELWKDKPAPPVDVMQLSVANLGIVIEPNDPAGTYTVKARVSDLNAAQSVELVQQFVVHTAPAN